MKASDIEQLTGVTRDTLRYYEKIGLISRPPRSVNGYRIYGDVHLKQLKFIKYAQFIGFPLSKIKLAIPHLENPDPNCPHLQDAINEQLQEIENKIVQLNEAKGELLKWIKPTPLI